MQGYGGTQAFLPASISLEGAANISSYVSNGNSKLPMVIHVQDQAGTDVTSGKSSRVSWVCQKLSRAQLAQR